jgi:hypothetical protein
MDHVQITPEWDVSQPPAIFHLGALAGITSLEVLDENLVHGSLLLFFFSGCLTDDMVLSSPAKTVTVHRKLVFPFGFFFSLEIF